MARYRGVIVVTHEGDVARDDLVKQLAEGTVLEVDSIEIECLQIVILWRSLVDVDE